MEEILIKVKADMTEFTPSIKAVQDLGLAAEKDVKSFEQLDKVTREKLQKSLGGTTVTAKQFNDAINKATKEGTAGVDKMAAATKKANAESVRGTETYRQVVKRLKDELFSLADQQSKRAIEIQKELATIIEKQKDLNATTAAFDPEASFTAFSQVAQGAIGSLQILTGTLQAFGVENERVNDIAQKLQGVLNLSQGINSVLGMGDAFKNLRVVLGLTTVAQTGLAVATEAEGAAATKAAVANRAFATSLSATGIGAIVVGIGLLIGAMMAYANSVDDATDSQERLKKSSEEMQQDTLDFITSLKAGGQAEVDQALRSIEKREQGLDLLKEQGATAVDIAKKELEIEKQRLAAAELAITLANRQNAARESNIDELISNSGKESEINKQLIDLDRVRENQLYKIAVAQAAVTKAINDQLKFAQDEAFKNRPKDADYLKPKDAIVAEVKDKMDVVGKTIETLSSEMPSIDIPIGITDEDLAQAADQLNALKDITSTFFDFTNALSAQETENRMADLEAQRDAGIITTKQYQEQVKALRNDQAEQTKAQAAFEAAIGVAVAIINALRTPPAPNFAAGALAATLGAIQVAAIASRPVPKFKEGTLSVPGIDQGRDSVYAMLQPKEGVMPVDIMRDYYPVIDAAYNRKIPASVMNNFIRSETKGGRRTNPYDFKYAMDGIGIKVKNTDQLASAIARKLPSQNRISQKHRL